MTNESIFIWRAHPARARPKRTAAAILAIALLVTLIFLICFFDGLSPATSSIVAMASLFVLVLALNRFFFSSRFEIDEEKITAHHPLKTHALSWDRVRRFLHDQHGGYLSTRAQRSRLDAFRGMHLLFDESHRDQIIAMIEKRTALT